MWYLVIASVQLGSGYRSCHAPDAAVPICWHSAPWASHDEEGLTSPHNVGFEDLVIFPQAVICLLTITQMGLLLYLRSKARLRTHYRVLKGELVEPDTPQYLLVRENARIWRGSVP